MNLTERIAYQKAEQIVCDRLLEWLTDPKREPAQTKFTAGPMRDLAKEIEYKLKEK